MGLDPRLDRNDPRYVAPGLRALDGRVAPGQCADAANGPFVPGTRLRDPDEPTVAMVFQHPVTITLIDGSPVEFPRKGVHYQPGQSFVEQVPESIADNWYLRSSGVYKYDESKATPAQKASFEDSSKRWQSQKDAVAASTKLSHATLAKNAADLRAAATAAAAEAADRRAEAAEAAAQKAEADARVAELGGQRPVRANDVAAVRGAGDPAVSSEQTSANAAQEEKYKADAAAKKK